MNVSKPDDREIYVGEIADYWFDDGILISLSKPVKRTEELIRRNVALVQQITHHQRVPLLIYLSKSPVPDKATRRFSATQVPVIYKAMAMVSHPGLSVLVMRMVFALKPPPIPAKGFTNTADAKQWLQQFLPQNPI